MDCQPFSVPQSDWSFQDQSFQPASYTFHRHRKKYLLFYQPQGYKQFVNAGFLPHIHTQKIKAKDSILSVSDPSGSGIDTGFIFYHRLFFPEAFIDY